MIKIRRYSSMGVVAAANTIAMMTTVAITNLDVVADKLF